MRKGKINVIRVLFIALVAIILFGAGFWQYSSGELNRRIAMNENIFASSTLAYSSVIKQQRTKIGEMTDANVKLTGLLTNEQRKSLALEDVRRNNEQRIDVLTKLTTIDPELLKKYSKVFFLSENYVPPKLRDIDLNLLTDMSKPQQVLDNVYPFLTDMIKAAAQDGINLLVISGYRSFAYQKTLKADYKIIYGAGTANQFSAEQGYSEHQLGTAVDFGTPEVRGADNEFETTSAYRWLNQNAYKYGFVISYPKANTFYNYEPWHWRFVGKSLSQDLHSDGKYFYEVDQRVIDGYLIKIFD